MAFENHQQDAFNLRNDTESLKQWQSELDKATTSIGAAEVAAEEELLGVRLKNLTKTQQTKLTQLNQLLELEEKSIQELAKLKLTLSNRQFAIRKKEIQKEFQLYRAEAENFYKSISKYKSTTPAVAPKKASTTSDIKASTNNKAADAAIQKADKKVKIAEFGIDKLIQNVNEATSSMQELAEAAATTSTKRKAQPTVQQQTDTRTKPENNSSVDVKAEAQKEQAFSSDSKGLKSFDLGDFGFTDIIPALRVIQAAQREELAAAKEGKQAFDFSGVITALDELKGKGEKATSQTTVDFAGELVKQAEEAEKSITKLREFNENRAQNMRLIQLAEQQRLNKELADAEYKTNIAEANAYASVAFTQAHEDELRAIEHQKLINQHAIDYDKYLKDILAADEKAKDLEYNRTEYLNKELDNLERGHKEEQNKLTKSLIDTEAKGIDLKLNKDRYVAEEAQRLQQQFADKENQLLESRHKREAKIAGLEDESNKKKLIAQNLEDLRSQHAENEIKLREAHNIELARAIQLEQDHASLLADKIKQLGEEHTKKQNDLNDGLNDAEAKKVDLETNGDAYVYEETLTLEKAFRDKQNELTEAEYKRKAQLDYIEAHRKELIDQNLEDLRSQHGDEEVQRRKEHIKALARSTQLEEDRHILLEDAKKKLADEHTNKQNDLKQGALDNEVKAADLQENEEQYILEARMAHENAFYARKNELEEESIQLAESIAWDKAHIDEVMAQELQGKRLGYLKEYQEYQKKAGKYAVSQTEFEKDKAKKDNKAAKKEATTGIIDGVKKFGTGEFSMTDIKKSYGEYMGQRTAELQDSGMNEASAKLTAQFELLAEVSGNLAQQLSQTADKIGEKQASIDTRLQGSTANDTKFGSYWRQLVRDMNKIGAVNPYFKQEDFAANIETLVNKGISFDIKQRAFLMTIQEKIANTFDVADGTLLRLIRIQQQDTTAGRLGMESALNSFLNSMYETSEYLTDVAASVRGSLEEMQALMEGVAGTELEFQVQKWMGSLYSVGMSQEAVQGIAQTFGQLASGDISGLTGNGTSNLLIMAANEAGMSIADILQEGLDAKETNKLMQAMVNYLAEIAETSSDSRVVQQQLANVYGIKASDLRAATNLAASIKDVSKQDLTYSGMLGQLNKMANSMALRTSTGEMLSNVWDNFQYTMGSQMASDPILYLLPKVANLLEDAVGGIDLPFINVMGFGVDLNTSVAQLMNVAAMSGSILGALGPMISGLAGAVSGSAMLSLAGINTSGKAPVIARGAPAVLQNVSGSSISESGYIGNSSGNDVKNATLQGAADDKKKQMVEAKEDESSDDVVIKSQLAVVSIYNLLEEVAHGSQSLRVRVINANGGGFGGSVGGSSSGSTTSGQNTTIGDTTGDGSTSAIAAAGKNGTDNGNWVLSF